MPLAAVIREGPWRSSSCASLQFARRSRRAAKPRFSSITSESERRIRAVFGFHARQAIGGFAVATQKTQEKRRFCFGPSPASPPRRDGLVTRCPLTGNVGVLLGGTGTSLGETPALTSVPAGGLGAITFLEDCSDFWRWLPTELKLRRNRSPRLAGLCWLIDSASESGGCRLRCLPKQVADAVIRSMLKGVEPVLSTTEGPAPKLSDVAPLNLAPALVTKSEDWDIPLDWNAPEELAESDLEPR